MNQGREMILHQPFFLCPPKMSSLHQFSISHQQNGHPLELIFTEAAEAFSLSFGLAPERPVFLRNGLDVLWMEEIVHQLRLVVYPIIYMVFFTDISGGFLNHQGLNGLVAINPYMYDKRLLACISEGHEWVLLWHPASLNFMICIACFLRKLVGQFVHFQSNLWMRLMNDSHGL